LEITSNRNLSFFELYDISADVHEEKDLKSEEKALAQTLIEQTEIDKKSSPNR